MHHEDHRRAHTAGHRSAAGGTASSGQVDIHALQRVRTIGHIGQALHTGGQGRSGVAHPFYDEVMGANPLFWAAVSPYHALSGPVPPFQFVCSTERPDHPCLQAQGMARRVRDLGGRAEVLPQELTHGEINAQLGLESAYTRAVETFMASLDAVVAQRLK